MACAATAAAAALPFSCAAAVSSAATRISRGPGSPCSHLAWLGLASSVEGFVCAIQGHPGLNFSMRAVPFALPRLKLLGFTAMLPQAAGQSHHTDKSVN